MKKQNSYESIQEPLDDEERELMNPDNWDWDNPVEGVTVGEPRVSLTIPFTFDELDAIVEGATHKGCRPRSSSSAWCSTASMPPAPNQLDQPQARPHLVARYAVSQLSRTAPARHPRRPARRAGPRNGPRPRPH